MAWMPGVHSFQVASAYHRAGKLREAEMLYRHLLAWEPASAEAFSDLGNVLCDAGRAREAIGEYERAIQINPRYVPAYNNLGTALRDWGRARDAIEVYRIAIAIDPNFPEVYNNLGVALTELGRLDAALEAFGTAIGLRPGYADAHSNFGLALYASQEPEGAAAECARAVELDPNSTKAHSNLSLILLGAGQYPRGWVEHEWRFKCNPTFIARPFQQPQWKGEPLEGKTILLHAEQGLGDTIQFCRYAPLVAGRGGNVILECQGELLRLLEGLDGRMQILPRQAALPAFDVQCPLMSLPLAFGTTVENIPAQPYLKASARLAAEWAARLEGERRPRVGLVWAGRPTHSNDANRSMQFAQLAPLVGIDGIAFYSLQRGSAAKQLGGAEGTFDPTDELTDFAETAGLIANLDLVICVDTALAHLAGAIGKPTWVLLPYAAEWRWMTGREDSPWYPTARLFRQKRWGDWGEVVGRVAEALRRVDWSTMRR